MKTAIWIVCGVLAATWTGGAFAAAGLTHWAAELIASGAALDMGRAVAEWPVPAWLAPWVDAAGVQSAQAFLVTVLTWLRDAWPSIGSLVGWLVPAIWVVWALGLALMLLLAGVGHWLAGRMAAPQAQAA